MPERPEPATELRRHARWLDEAFEPFDPTSLRQRAEAEAVVGSPEVPRPLDDERDRSGPARRRPVLVLAAAVVVVIGVLAAMAVARRAGDPSDSRVDVAGEPQALTWTDGASASWPGTLGGSVIPVWTGREVVLVGQLVDPATSLPPTVSKPLETLGPLPAYDPVLDRWRTVDRPPIALPAAGAVAAWTGAELVVTNAPLDASGPGTSASGAAYDPTTDRWRTIAAAPPGRGVGGPGVWTTDRILYWALGVGVTAYVPATDSWEIVTTEAVGETGSPTFNSATASAVWTGTELVVADSGSSGVAAFDPSSNTWRRLPDRPQIAGAAPLAWNGRVIGTGDARGPAWMEPGASAWTRALSSPAIGIVPTAQAWTPDDFLAWGGPDYGGTPGSRPQVDGAMRVDLTTGARSSAAGPSIGDPPFTGAIVAGDHIVTWGATVGGVLIVGEGPAMDTVSVRAAVSSSLARSDRSTSPPTAPPGTPTTTVASVAAYCASFRSFLDAYVTTANVTSGSLASADARAADQRRIDSFGELVDRSPAQIQPAMVTASRAVIEPGASVLSVEQTTAFDQIDRWLWEHCGFGLYTVGTATPTSVDPGSAPPVLGTVAPG